MFHRPRLLISVRRRFRAFAEHGPIRFGYGKGNWKMILAIPWTSCFHGLTTGFWLVVSIAVSASFGHSSKPRRATLFTFPRLQCRLNCRPSVPFLEVMGRALQDAQACRSSRIGEDETGVWERDCTAERWRASRGSWSSLPVCPWFEAIEGDGFEEQLNAREWMKRVKSSGEDAEVMSYKL